MKKQKLLLSLFFVITFIGGFYSGVLFSNNSNNRKVVYETEQEKIETIDKEEPKAIEQYETDKVLIGYVQDFRDPSTIDYTNLTHIIFSFAHPTSDGQLLLNGETALSNLRTTVQIAHNQGSKAILAIGGWFHIQGGESYDYFRAAISNPISRTKLINELVSMVDRENLDGIDIDFEHPRKNEDAQNLALFTKELSDHLRPKGKELSIAVNAKIHSVVGTEIHSVIYEPSMFQAVDHVNIMAYDGQWDGDYNAANLSPYTYNENIVNYWSTLFDTHQISKEKLILGVPFYAQPEDPTGKQISYDTIINHNPDNATKDIVNINGMTYHYNGEATVQRKTKLALEHGFGGMMMWEIGHDSEDESLVTAISEAMEAGNQYTAKQDQ